MTVLLVLWLTCSVLWRLFAVVDHLKRPSPRVESPPAPRGGGASVERGDVRLYAVTAAVLLFVVLVMS